VRTTRGATLLAGWRIRGLVHSSRTFIWGVRQAVTSRRPFRWRTRRPGPPLEIQSSAVLCGPEWDANLESAQWQAALTVCETEASIEPSDWRAEGLAHDWEASC
jgi:hypothetical protein